MSTPIAFRPTEDDTSSLAQVPGSVTEVIRKGIAIQASLCERLVPLYPRSVHEPEIALAVEEAARAAVERLDVLFEGKAPESQGISSQFQGLLEQHLRAMLRGRPFHLNSHRIPLNPLFGDSDSYGKCDEPSMSQGIALLKVKKTLGEPDMVLDPDKRRFVPEEKLEAGSLFTSVDAAVEFAFIWLKEEEMEPRENRLQLQLYSFAADGPLQRVP